MKRFLQGFVYAFQGLRICICEERNFRFDLAVVFHLFAYLRFFTLTRAEICLLVALCGLVISLEAVNTAVEHAVDATGRYDAVTKAAKDTAAGAVLTAAVAAAICGVKLLWQPKAFAAIICFFAEHPWAIVLQAAVLVCCGWFIFEPTKGKRPA